MTTISGCPVTRAFLQCVNGTLSKIYEDERKHVLSLLEQAELVTAERPHMLLRACYLLECGSIAMRDTLDRCTVGKDARDCLTFIRGPMTWSVEGVQAAQKELKQFSEDMRLMYSCLQLEGEVKPHGNVDTFRSIGGSGFKPAANIAEALAGVQDRMVSLLGGGETFASIGKEVQALLHKAGTPSTYQIGVAERLLAISPTNVLTPWTSTNAFQV